jgi:hypothetical protein
MSQNAAIIDVATRFLRTNPELLEVARSGAGESGRPVEALLADVVLRIRRSGFQPIAKEDVLAAHDVRPRLFVIPLSNPRGDAEEQLVS